MGWLLPHVNGVRSVEPIGEVAQAAAYRLGAAHFLPSRSTQAIPRPGNWAAIRGATQPCLGGGSHPNRTRQPWTSHSADLRCASGLQEIVGANFQLTSGQLADRRVSQVPPGYT